MKRMELMLINGTILRETVTILVLQLTSIIGKFYACLFTLIKYHRYAHYVVLEKQICYIVYIYVISTLCVFIYSRFMKFVRVIKVKVTNEGKMEQLICTRDKVRINAHHM